MKDFIRGFAKILIIGSLIMTMVFPTQNAMAEENDNSIVQDYIPISGIEFQEGKTFTVEVSKFESATIKVDYKVIPENTTGYIADIKYDTNYIKPKSGQKKNPTLFTPVKYGKSKILYYDEQGRLIDYVIVKVIPKSIEDVFFDGVGKKIKIQIYGQSIKTNGDYVRIYQKKNKKWILKKQVKKSKLKSYKKYISIKESRINKKYKLKLTNYDSKTKSESSKKKTFIASTGIKIKKTKVLKLNEIHINKFYARPLKMYYLGRPIYGPMYNICQCNAWVKVKKVKGADGYDFNLHKSSISKTTGHICLAWKSVKNKKIIEKALPKTVKLKVRAYKDINDYSRAYGPWSQKIKVKIR